MMSKRIYKSLIVSAIILLTGVALAFAQGRPYGYGPGYGGPMMGNGPEYGGYYGMGPGMMGNGPGHDQ